MANLADVDVRLGRLDEAEGLLSRAIELAYRVLGENHSRSSRCRGLLAWTYIKQKRYTEGLRLLQDTEVTLAATLGDDHPRTIWVKNRLGDAYHELLRFEDAEKMFQEVISARRAVWGDRGYQTAEVEASLALVYIDTGRFEDAEPLTVRFLESSRLERGVNNPSTLAAMHVVACTKAGLEKSGEAIAIVREGLELGFAKHFSSAEFKIPCFESLQGHHEFEELLVALDAEQDQDPE